MITRDDVLAYLHTLKDGQAELMVNCEELGQALGCSRESAGQQLSFLGFTTRKLRMPDGTRRHVRVLPVADLPPLPKRPRRGTPARATGPKVDPQAKPRGRLADHPGLAVACSLCGSLLVDYMRPVGWCQDCLHAVEVQAPSDDPSRRPPMAAGLTRWGGHRMPIKRHESIMGRAGTCPVHSMVHLTRRDSDGQENEERGEYETQRHEKHPQARLSGAQRFHAPGPTAQASHAQGASGGDGWAVRYPATPSGIRPTARPAAIAAREAAAAKRGKAKDL